MVAFKLARWAGGGTLAVVIAVAALAAPQPKGEVVTVAKPVELPKGSFMRSSSHRSSSLTVTVVGYVPARKGSVMAVVRVRNAKTGVSREIGRFGIFPDAPFTASTLDMGQRFGLSLSDQDMVLIKSADARLVVSLEPLDGKGDGARIIVGGAELN